eukprot:4983094-Prymnesium_polylepis.1
MGVCVSYGSRVAGRCRRPPPSTCPRVPQVPVRPWRGGRRAAGAATTRWPAGPTCCQVDTAAQPRVG